MENNDIEPDAGAYTISGANLTVTARRNYALQHFSAARYFAEELRQLELKILKSAQTNDSEENPEIRKVPWLFYASIMSSTACIEAFYNELLPDTPVDKDFLVLWERKPLQKKFDYLLKIQNKSALDWGGSPGQDIIALIKLRNAIVHFRPSLDDDDDAIVSVKIENAMRNKGETSNLISENQPFFPRRCCSASYADWSINSVLHFLELVQEKLEVNVAWLNEC